MSYDSQNTTSISFPVTAAAQTQYWRAPRSGHLWDINLSTTTSWVGTTSPLKIEVGVTGTLAKFGELRAGTAASPTQAGTPLSARYTNTAGASIVNPHADFAKGDLIVITVTAPVGTPAGAGIASVTFQMDN